MPWNKKILAHIEMADPVTWISPAIITFCGAIASGAFSFSRPRDLALASLGALMTGPLCTGFSQSINDYFDRDLDAINDPTRPIPSGRLTLTEARLNWIFLAVATLLVSLVFANPLIVVLAVFGLILSTLYSVEPFKLKKYFWLGPPAVGLGYVAMAWIAGHLIFAQITWESAIVAWLNGGLATGLLFLNDIKSVEGDRKHGLKSMTVALGLRRTLLIAFGVVTLFELLLLAYALWRGQTWFAIFVFLALVVPIFSQIRLFRDPSHKNFMLYLLASNPFIVLIQILSAFVVGGYFD